MKRFLSLLFCFTGWFALTVQYYLMLETSKLSFWETTARFFSYFTILTNLLVTVYFTYQALRNTPSKPENSGILSAVTVYILMVGLIYQILLRQTWNPEGMQRIADETLHTIIPVLVLVYWCCYENKNALNYRMIPKWAVYPLLYFIYILIQGPFSGFYPYPFIDVSQFGILKVLINAFWIVLFFATLSAILIRIGKSLKSDEF
ncbi:Pr6Pr family membrane protein [Chryseobacterium sp. OSA05B]|uniref:Pr6Pr family membrane protein n=1 Tax=Chryseobacterium sp. OSA05B TaxID=2862650 RepID=UPI001CBC6127|nr:Pr6Pr family membrane protein [Chryseobacterium sp. OSA05B]